MFPKEERIKNLGSGTSPPDQLSNSKSIINQFEKNEPDSLELNKSLKFGDIQKKIITNI